MFSGNPFVEHWIATVVCCQGVRMLRCVGAELAGAVWYESERAREQGGMKVNERENEKLKKLRRQRKRERKTERQRDKETERQRQRES